MQKNILKVMIIATTVFIGSIGTLSATQTGDRIESSAKKSYVFMTYLKDDDIKIAMTNDSIVTLTGTVSERMHRSLAEETIAALPGVVNAGDLRLAKCNPVCPPDIFHTISAPLIWWLFTYPGIENALFFRKIIFHRSDLVQKLFEDDNCIFRNLWC